MMFTGFGLTAQTFSINKVSPSGTSITGTVTNGDVLTYSTSANAQTKFRLRITNNSSSNTYTYTVKRTIVAQNPMLVVSGVSVAPQTFMCVGTTCYDNSISTQTNTAEMTVLSPGQHSDATAQPFLVYLDEASTLGFYVVRYKVFNINNANDTLSFTVKYNDYLSVNESGSIISETSDVFPNPVIGNASVSISLKQESPVTMQLFNSLGTLVYNGNEQRLSQGKHKLSVDCSGFAAGVYILQINSGNDKISKRFLLNK